MFHIDIRNIDDFTFYYNIEKGINSALQQILPQDIINKLPTVKNGLADKNGDYARMVSLHKYNGQFETLEHFEMHGIAATVSKALAEEIVERAKYYCPVDKGELINSFRIEDLGGGSCRIYNDCPYAWYVEEFTWKKHNYPKQAKFLTQAIEDIETKYGLWAHN